MSKFLSVNSKRIIEILEKNGFVLDRVKGSHRIYFNEKTKRRVVVPFHKVDLPIGTLLEILKEAGISRDEL
ncbi:type II toxin-antitoxin system HicA family toxin [Athalassotoga saccharophila]|uniref:type II toxin-antitoxin system HicA family toxin n=1 Tax=Athalassotoga saccharophila TaxID=1441386 RepID=UPI001379D3F4|nr:type II toxin-antitoxin system HicA family toxin [Athalassotoga saccharophila]BBJ27761.1 YcfA-like protein [Athalassotoga saccharophila]